MVGWEEGQTRAVIEDAEGKIQADPHRAIKESRQKHSGQEQFWRTFWRRWPGEGPGWLIYALSADYFGAPYFRLGLM